MLKDIYPRKSLTGRRRINKSKWKIDKKENLRDPSLASLDGEQCEHGNKAVVVVKVLPVPLPGSDHGWQVRLDVLEIHSPEDRFYILHSSQLHLIQQHKDDKEFLQTLLDNFTELHYNQV